MGHLEQIPWPVVVGDPFEEVVVVVVLEVAGEQDALLPDAHRQHDRGAVDGATVREDPVRDGVCRRPQDVDAGLAQRERIALGEASSWDVVAEGRGPQLEHATALGVHVRLEDTADSIARQQPGQARRMVLVRVREQSDVDVAVPAGDAFVEAAHE